MPDKVRKRILYLDHNLYLGERYENKEYHEIVNNIEIFGVSNIDKAKLKTVEIGNFDLVGIHLSTNCAFYYAKYIRDRNRDIPIIVLSGVGSHAKKRLDEIGFPYDQILNIFLMESPEESARTLVGILERIESAMKKTGTGK